jgi:hypothetical protein
VRSDIHQSDHPGQSRADTDSPSHEGKPKQTLLLLLNGLEVVVEVSHVPTVLPQAQHDLSEMLLSLVLPQPLQV